MRLVGVEFRSRRIPKGGAPAVLLVEGSGKAPDSGLAEDFPFYQLGRALAGDGFYVLTFNKRGSGLNGRNGSFYRSSFWTDNKDAQAALDFVKSLKHVAADRIFLLGQSMGGVHITYLAQKNKVAGNIYFASAFKDFKETLRQQNRDVLGLLGRPRKEINTELGKLRKLLKAIESGTFRKADYPDACQRLDGANVIDGVQEKYFRDVLRIDNACETAKLGIPLLIMQGTADFIINLDDLKAVKLALKKAGKKNARLKVLAGVDHIFSDQADKAASFRYMSRVKKTRKFKPVSGKILSEVRKFLADNSG